MAGHLVGLKLAQVQDGRPAIPAHDIRPALSQVLPSLIQDLIDQCPIRIPARLTIRNKIALSYQGV